MPNFRRFFQGRRSPKEARAEVGGKSNFAKKTKEKPGKVSTGRNFDTVLKETVQPLTGTTLKLRPCYLIRICVAMEGTLSAPTGLRRPTSSEVDCEWRGQNGLLFDKNLCYIHIRAWNARSPRRPACEGPQALKYIDWQCRLQNGRRSMYTL